MTNGHESVEDRDEVGDADASPRANNNGGDHEETWLASLEHEIEEVAAQPPPVLFLRVLKLDLPYIVMLAAAIFGVRVANFTGLLTPLYWKVLAPL